MVHIIEPSLRGRYPYLFSLLVTEILCNLKYQKQNESVVTEILCNLKYQKQNESGKKKLEDLGHY